MPENFFSFFQEDYFPRLTPRGLNIADNVASLFNDYNLNSIDFTGFNLKLLRQNDIVLKNKVRYNFALQMGFDTVYAGKNTTILKFSLQAQTINFTSLQELRDSFENNGNTLSTHLFWKPVVEQLTTDGGNDLTNIAKTAIGESLFNLKVNLTDSIIDQSVLQQAQKSFEDKILDPFHAERVEAKRIHDEEARRLEAERKRIAAELKAKEDEARRIREEHWAFYQSTRDVKSFKEFWAKRSKNVADKKQLIEALKLSFQAKQNPTFELLTNAFRNAINWYYNDKKHDEEAKRTAFGSGGISFAQSGLNGIFMPNWLRWELINRANIQLQLQNVKVRENNFEVYGWGVPVSINWNDHNNGINYRATTPWTYGFEITMNYKGSYGLKGIYWTLANWGLGGIPPEWSGDMELKFQIDGKLANWITQKQDYPGSLFQFQNDKLLFTLHVVQRITVKDQRFMNLLKKQQLDVIEPWGGEIKVPVVDLASYLHFLILADK
ncbi:MG032/MG096/MG288 family 2 [Mycoplasmoides pneumoniae FH]|uniref:MG032/MG096/MG288 family 2 n=1 Tax=Mycoplasmoides pneumoniae (strain ATCC 15531 / DSM 23978 / CIP 103766 / NBRC 14401 / NCTC 10119 / FH) TaxID=722438 RepID=A0A0H3DK56_MYCPB|nr:MG032/MG096/MG288 family 2 [Mycoplasmoides pneumoniae FH]